TPEKYRDLTPNEAVDSELKNTTTQTITATCNYRGIKGSLRLTGRHITADYSFEGEGCAGMRGGRFDGNMRTDRPFQGSWKFSADAGFTNLKVVADVGSTFSFNGKSFKLTETGWAEDIRQ